MTTGRADPMADFDLSDFAVKPAARPKIDVAAVREASEKQNFPSRAAKKTAPEEMAASTLPEPRLAPHSPSSAFQGARWVDTPSPRHQQRRRRTGRSHQLNLKVEKEVADRFIKLADAHQWVFGEAFEKAVAALEEKYPVIE